MRINTYYTRRTQTLFPDQRRLFGLISIPTVLWLLDTPTTHHVCGSEIAASASAEKTKQCGESVLHQASPLEGGRVLKQIARMRQVQARNVAPSFFMLNIKYYQKYYQQYHTSVMGIGGKVGEAPWPRTQQLKDHSS